jgi:hypothetical protein
MSGHPHLIPRRPSAASRTSGPDALVAASLFRRQFFFFKVLKVVEAVEANWDRQSAIEVRMQARLPDYPLNRFLVGLHCLHNLQYL